MAAAILALTALGCGTGEPTTTTASAAISPAQQQNLADGGATIQADAQQVGELLADCSQSGQGIRCVGPIITDFGVDVNLFAETVGTVADAVMGLCQQQLTAAADALNSLGDAFEKFGSAAGESTLAAAASRLKELAARASSINGKIVGATGSRACQSGDR